MIHWRSVYRLLRTPNLAIMACTIWVVVYRLIYPPLVHAGLLSTFTSNDWFSVLITALCLGAATYVHNDIVDVVGDRYNGKRQIVGYSISPAFGWLLYTLLTLGPIPIVLSLAIEYGRMSYLSYYIGIAIAMWSYNHYFQRHFLIGNIIVAALCSLSVLMPYILEYPSISMLKETHRDIYDTITVLIGGYALFIYMSNLIREIIKDVQDIAGDRSTGMRTMAVVMEYRKTLVIARWLSRILWILIIAWLIFALRPRYDVWYVTVACLLLVPMIILEYLFAKTLADHGQLQTLITGWKLYMAISLISMYLSTHFYDL